MDDTFGRVPLNFPGMGGPETLRVVTGYRKLPESKRQELSPAGRTINSMALHGAHLLQMTS